MRYYSTQRPIMPGGYPNAADVTEINNFDEKAFCEEIGAKAWGYVDYWGSLSPEQIADYELTPAGMKTYWSVTTSIYDDGRITSNITSKVRAVCKPDDAQRSTKQKDIYVEWFEKHEDAENWVKEAENA
ncbi:MAG: hypothetical protein PHS82_03130 [Lachnospiraceae bacterium]|nr:hypothetical protein [Lachnospiraceae bacterium]